MKKHTITLNHPMDPPAWYENLTGELHRLAERANRETPSEKKLHGCTPDSRDELKRKADLERRQTNWSWTAGALRALETGVNQARRDFEAQAERFEAKQRAEARG
jgi:hypothetical protein